MQKIRTKDGYVDDEGYELNDDGERTGKRQTQAPTKEYFSIKGKNIVHTYFWSYNLQGKLKQEETPPAEYHGHPRPYVREDIEEDTWNNTVTSYLRVYIGRELKAQLNITHPRRSVTIMSYEAGDRDVVRRKVAFLLNEEISDDGIGHFGWELYTGNPMELRKKKKSLKKVKRTVKPKKKIKKVVRKKVIPKKRK
jgi:hypothetical protein